MSDDARVAFQGLELVDADYQFDIVSGAHASPQRTNSQGYARGQCLSIIPLGEVKMSPLPLFATMLARKSISRSHKRSGMTPP